uniref:Rho/rac guanine nucleotide exchange factor (GEF) 18a n=1 Tax=Astyanax mexicanus TaxID=7994 RepID=A0A8B9JBE8_ASTMX
MDEPDLIRPKVLPEDLSFYVYGVCVDDQYSILREDLETDARDFESPTWSLAVDQQYLKAYSKDAIKRQDVIHELIQTEINHVRTLKLLLGVYAYEVRCSLQKEEVQLERLFPRLEHLLREHQQFLNRLQQRRQDCLEPDSKQNYTINKIGDILLHTQKCFNKRITKFKIFYIQNLISKIAAMAIVRRLGVPEGILLVTQRITKYPVLVERLIKNTEDGTEEHKDLTLALKCLKETISLVDEQVHHYEKLRELIARLEPKSLGRMSTGLHIRREELLQHGRKLLREGVLSWRAQNRAKGSAGRYVLCLSSVESLQNQLVAGESDVPPPLATDSGINMGNDYSELLTKGFLATDKYVCVCVCVLLCVRPQVAMAQQDSEVGVLRAALAERPSRNRGDGLLVQEKQRHLEKQREELLHLQKVYNQQKQEQAEWELERQRHQLEHQALQQQLRQREEECARQEALLAEQRDALHQSRQEYQQDLERLRESARTVEKQREQLEQQQKKLNKPNIANPGPSFHLEPPQAPPLYPVDNIYPSPEHHRPPQVPPRKESIMVSPIKQDVPIQLVSTTNESIKPSSVQQQIPTKLAANKGREKSSSRGKSHQRTNSAASIEVSYLIPIKPGKEGGSLKARRPTSPRSLPAGNARTMRPLRP